MGEVQSRGDYRGNDRWLKSLSSACCLKIPHSNAAMNQRVRSPQQLQRRNTTFPVRQLMAEHDCLISFYKPSIRASSASCSDWLLVACPIAWPV